MAVDVPLQTDLDALTARVTALEATVATLQSQVAALQSMSSLPAGITTGTTTTPPATTAPPPSNPPPAAPASADGSTVPPASQLTDASGNTFALTAGGQVTFNGTLQAGTNGVTQLVAEKGVVYQTAHNLWWGWINGAWTSSPSPLPAPTVPASPPPAAGTAPPPAAAAGFKTLSFESGGNTPWKVSGPVTGTGVNWWGDSGWHAPFTGTTSVSNNVLTITDTSGQSSLLTSPYDAHEAGYSIQPPFYMEARLMGPNTSFIGFGYDHYRTNSGGHWPELDVVETHPDTGLTNGILTVHDWVNGVEPVQFNNTPWGPPGNSWNSPKGQWADFSSFHVVGALVLPGKAVSGFLDNNTSPCWTDPTYYVAYDTAKFLLWISAWQRTASQFDYVRVWTP